MRPFLLLLALGLVAVPVSAQTTPREPLQHGDVAATLGWLNVNKSDLPREQYDRNDWYNRSAIGTLGLGWYWTDHLKSEIEFGASTTADLRRTEPVQIGPRPLFTSSVHSFSTRRLALAQQYQFFRNAWFHPHLGGGIDLTWERSEVHIEPIFTYDDIARQARQVAPARTIGPETTLTARPFATGGFKAYLSQRAFFRTDARFAFGDEGLDEVIVRFGFGADF